MACTSDGERDKFRISVTDRIVQLGERYWSSGGVDHWLAGSDEHVKAVAKGLNGPLVSDLAGCIKHRDEGLGEMLLGAPLIGKIPCSGYGSEPKVKEIEDPERLWEDRWSVSEETVNSLRKSKLGGELLKQTKDEAVLGRMSVPVQYKPGDFDGVLSKRFAVEQEEKPRCIDDGSASRVNRSAAALERIHEDRLGEWFTFVQFLTLIGMAGLLTFKVDVKSAFRRVPLLPQHRWAAGVAFLADGKVWVSQHYAMPFGFLASVFSWERLGMFIKRVGIVLLRIPLSKYVDDFYAVETAACGQTALNCLVRVVQALLGPGALSPKKIMIGNPLPLLGFSVLIGKVSASFTLVASKRVKWLAMINGCLESGLYIRGVLLCLLGGWRSRPSFCSKGWGARCCGRSSRSSTRVLTVVGSGISSRKPLSGGLRCWSRVSGRTMSLSLSGLKQRSCSVMQRGVLDTCVRFWSWGSTLGMSMRQCLMSGWSG